MGVCVFIVSFFLPWLDQNSRASNGQFRTLDNLSCSAQFLIFFGANDRFFGMFCNAHGPGLHFRHVFPSMSGHCIGFLKNFGRNTFTASCGSCKCNAVNLLSIHATHTHTHTHTQNSILQAAFARASKSTVRLRQKTVHPTVAPSVEQLPPQPLQQLQRQPTRVRQLPQLPRPQYQVLGVFLCSVYVIGSSSDNVGRS